MDKTRRTTMREGVLITFLILLLWKKMHFMWDELQRRRRLLTFCSYSSDFVCMYLIYGVQNEISRDREGFNRGQTNPYNSILFIWKDLENQLTVAVRPCLLLIKLDIMPTNLFETMQRICCVQNSVHCDFILLMQSARASFDPTNTRSISCIW